MHGRVYSIIVARVAGSETDYVLASSRCPAAGSVTHCTSSLSRMAPEAPETSAQRNCLEMAMSDCITSLDALSRQRLIVLLLYCALAASTCTGVCPSS